MTCTLLPSPCVSLPADVSDHREETKSLFLVLSPTALGEQTGFGNLMSIRVLQTALQTWISLEKVGQRGEDHQRKGLPSLLELCRLSLQRTYAESSDGHATLEMGQLCFES